MPRARSPCARIAPCRSSPPTRGGKLSASRQISGTTIMVARRLWELPRKLLTCRRFCREAQIAISLSGQTPCSSGTWRRCSHTLRATMGGGTEDGECLARGAGPGVGAGADERPLRQLAAEGGIREEPLQPRDECADVEGIHEQAGRSDDFGRCATV